MSGSQRCVARIELVQQAMANGEQSEGPNFTPPFPAYPSGHAGFGGALFQTLRRFYRTDRVPFTFLSDELNGVTQTHDHEGSRRLLYAGNRTSRVASVTVHLDGVIMRISANP